MDTLRAASARPPSEGLAGALTTVGTGAAVRAGSRIVVTACTFLTTALVVRAVGAELYGALAFGLSVVGLIAGLFAGLGTAATRSIASAVATDDDPDHAVRALTALVIAVVGLGGIALAFAITVSQRQLTGAQMAVLAASMTLLLLGRVSAVAGSSVARGVGRVGLMEIPSTVEVVVKLLLVFAAVTVIGQRGPMPLASVYAGAGLAAAVASVVVVRRARGSFAAMSPAARAGVDLVRLTAPFVIGAVAYRLIHGFDVAVLGVVQPGAAVGAYAPTLAMVEGLVMLVPGLLGAMFVTAATGLYESRDRESFGDLYLAVSKVSVILVMPALTLLAIAPVESLRAVYGDRFPASATQVWILLAGYFVTVAFGFNGQALVASGSWSAVGKALILPAVTMVVCALALIPAYGAIGAAIATSVSFVVLNASLSRALHRATGVHPLRIGRVVLLASAVIPLAIAAALWHAAGAGFWVAVACSMIGWAIWVGLILVTRLLRLDEIHALRPRKLPRVGGPS